MLFTFAMSLWRNRNVVGGRSVVTLSARKVVVVVVVGKQVTIDVDAVRTVAAAARHDLTDGAAVHRLAGSVADGGLLLRHRAATAALGTAAVRLRERLDTLRALVGQLADAVDASATAMDTMDGVNADKLDRISAAADRVTPAPHGWASSLHPEEE